MVFATTNEFLGSAVWMQVAHVASLGSSSQEILRGALDEAYAVCPIPEIDVYLSQNSLDTGQLSQVARQVAYTAMRYEMATGLWDENLASRVEGKIFLDVSPLQMRSDESASNAPQQCLRAVKELWENGVLKPGECQDNVKSLLEHLKSSRSSVDIHNARVLVIVRPTVLNDDTEPNISLLHTIKSKSESAFFHVVLECEGHIVDASAEEGFQCLPAREYFEKMFVLRPDQKIEADPNFSRAMQDSLVRRIVRNSFDDFDSVSSEVRVRAIPAHDYLSKYHSIIVKHVGDVRFYWETMEQSIPARNISKHFGWQALSASVDENGSSTTEFDQLARFGTVVAMFNEHKLDVGELLATKNAVMIRRGVDGVRAYFDRTNSGLEILLGMYSRRLLDVDNLKGKVVLDVATGGGLFPEELREKGVVAYGMDVALNRRQRELLFADTEGLEENTVRLENSLSAAIFLNGDALQTRIADGEVDAVYDTFGIFWNQFGDDPDSVAQAFMEWKRILKRDGVIRFGPVDETGEKEVRDFVGTIPGLSVTAFEPLPLSNNNRSRMVEVARVD